MSWLLKGFFCLQVLLVLFPDGQAVAKTSNRRNDTLKMTVLSFDFVNLPEKIQQQAREQVVRIYRRAGVEMEWADCPTQEGMPSMAPLCTGLQDETHLFFRIVPRALNGLRNSTAGFALRESRVAYVFWDRAQEQARQSDTPLPEMLAQLIAHEIGHLLLRPDAHVLHGIMAPCWKSQQLIKVGQGGCGFTQEQCKRIQDDVAKRQAQMTAHAKLKESDSSMN